MGIEIYKDKLERLIIFLYNFLNFKIIKYENNNVIVSSFDALNSKEEIITKDNRLNLPRFNGFVEYLPIIIDSNNLVNIYFLSNYKFDEDKSILKNIRNIVIDLLN